MGLERGKIVDHQAHWYPPECLEALLDRERPPRVRRDGDDFVLELHEGEPNRLSPGFHQLDLLLEEAGSAGVDTVLCSAPQLAAVMHLPVDEAVAILEAVHEAYGRMQRQLDGRFAGVAMLPMHDPRRAVEVLDRAVGVHGLRAVAMLASIDGAPIATPATLPVFRRIAELRVPLLLHPAYRSQTLGRDLGSPRAELGAAWMFHTSVAALNLIDSGVMDACPDLVVVHPHLGGMLPYVLGRVEWQKQETKATKPLSEYLRTRFYVDTVSRTPGAPALAIETYGIDRLLFGSDWPYFGLREARAFVETSAATAAEADAILHNSLPGDAARNG